MLVVSPVTFVADEKIMYGYNFVAPLKTKATCVQNQYLQNVQQERVQGLQSFVICIVNVGKRLGVKFKDGLCDELCLKLCFERDWHFCNITESGWFPKLTV